MLTREQWFNQAVQALRPLFKEVGDPIPKKVRVSVGWPGGRGAKRHVVGQCWDAKVVSDGTPAVFISPVLKDPIEVLVTLTHELVHSTGKKGHRKEFSGLAGKVGLVKPWKSTPASDELKDRLNKIARNLGKYDHGSIKQESLIRQATRLLKVACPEDGYTIRVTQKWLDAMGFTICPCGTEMERA